MRAARVCVVPARPIHRPADSRGRSLTASGRDSHLPKLYIPADGQGESPEQKAAKTLRRLFTWVAIRVVQSHLEGAGNDGGFAPQATNRDGTCGSPDYDDLRKAMESIPLGDGDEWLDAFMSVNPEVCLRIIVARETYVKEFDYEQARSITEDMIAKGNAQLMKRHATRSFGALE
ncbi:unnamed product [Ostreococcus tauri]|uniref:Unnamed product n=1 Tax=Ostreococcus tauri TaxID=70448 RepID=Q00SN2_OSTTA|nr:unnamed product [Ostreococcus tauri]OUS45135.1 hypothetical protein BE221DRAFT_77451 [Ostreococcus tauri]CAL58582.1 unnamed product [Ostreococcus tauri]|eukprot:XP_003084166.1 unnamed product [Ostreococcus tauri]